MDDIYLDEIMYLKSELSQKNIEIETLKCGLKTAKENIKNLELALLEELPTMNINSEKKSRNISDDARKRYDFYNKNKNNPEILEPLREKFKAVGLKHIPWYCVKDMTDELYNSSKKE